MDIHNFERNEAKDLARYYFRLIAENSGINWNSDMDTEIENLIDLIIVAAKEATVYEINKVADDQSR